MRQLSISAALAAAIFITVAVGANAQQASSRDGSYAGSMSVMPTTSQAGNTEQACVAQRPVNMTIQNGVVTIFYKDWGGNTIHYRGKIDAAGQVVASHTNGDGTRLTPP